MIADGYKEPSARISFEQSMSYDEFQRQPADRRIIIQMLFEIFVQHPWLKLETSYGHEMYGQFYRLADTRFGTTNVLYQFDGTIRIIRWSYEDSIIIPVTLDNMREVIYTIEEIYRKAN